jgi:hypothetical protein
MQLGVVILYATQMGRWDNEIILYPLSVAIVYLSLFFVLFLITSVFYLMGLIARLLHFLDLVALPYLMRFNWEKVY